MTQLNARLKNNFVQTERAHKKELCSHCSVWFVLNQTAAFDVVNCFEKVKKADRTVNNKLLGDYFTS